jgi:hypothetical protein
MLQSRKTRYGKNKVTKKPYKMKHTPKTLSKTQQHFTRRAESFLDLRALALTFHSENPYVQSYC